MNFVSVVKLETFKAALAKGLSISASAKEADIGRQAASKYAKDAERPNCGCGMPATHIGACNFRRTGIAKLTLVPPAPKPGVVVNLFNSDSLSEKEFGEKLVKIRPQLLYYSRIKLADRALAEDIVSETMVLALRNRASFKKGTNFEAWVWTIMRNQITNNYRQRSRRKSEPLENYEHKLVAKNDTDKIILGNEALAAIAKLPRKQRDVCFAIMYDGRSYEETSEIYGISVGSIKSILSRAKVRLRNALGG